MQGLAELPGRSAPQGLRAGGVLVGCRCMGALQAPKSLLALAGSSGPEGLGAGSEGAGRRGVALPG